MDRAEREANAAFIAHARTDVPALIAEVRRLREELGLDRMRLAACGGAALANDSHGVAMRIDKGHRYWSPSYRSVCDAVDREMALRDENERLRAKVAAWESIIHEIATAKPTLDDARMDYVEIQVGRATLSAYRKVKP
jgi:hypothetical protein